jgi:CBS domain-containing protein
MQPYKLIDIFTSEEARWQGQLLPRAVGEYIHDLKIPARLLIVRGVAGVYESGEISTPGIEVLGYNMPVWIRIILPAVEADRVTATLAKMVTDGIVAVQDLQVVSHRTKGKLLPKHVRVRDIMNPNPQRVQLTTPVNEVARLLLSSTFTGLPVVDRDNRPVGVISQTDLIYKAGLPMRLGLLAEAEDAKIAAVLEAMAKKQAREVMTSPAVVIHQEAPVTAAVDLMLQKGVKRLPVIDDQGRLVGNLSRVDIFHTILKECPDWQAFQKQQIKVENLSTVADIMRREVITVRPETPVEDLIRIIDTNDIQRICVVDENGVFLGLISDKDLLAAFADRHPGIWNYFVSKLPFTERRRRDKHLQRYLELQTAGDIMNTQIVTVPEETPVQNAIQIMLDGAFKRLPVVDGQGKLRGMVSREALLRAGFASLAPSAGGAPPGATPPSGSSPGD